MPGRCASVEGLYLLHTPASAPTPTHPHLRPHPRSMLVSSLQRSVMASWSTSASKSES